MLTGWRGANNHVLCSLAKYSWADDMVQVAKNEMWASEVCFACLTWPYGQLVCLMTGRVEKLKADEGYLRKTEGYTVE